MLPVAQVRTMPEVFQPRMSAVFEKHVSDLRTALRNAGELASILVMPIDDHAVVIDGHHRLEAYRMENRSTIPVEFFVGSVLDALLRSGSENSKVTLPLSLEQRGNFAWRLVQLRNAVDVPGWIYSRREISISAGISEGTVANMRRAVHKLGDEASTHITWRSAQEAAAGLEPPDLKPFGEEELEHRAQMVADRLAKSLGTHRAQHHEIMARGLTKFLGRNTPEVIMEMIAQCEADPALAEFVPRLHGHPEWDDVDADY
tara:strand:+ start:42630 stop:43406 length:777 start_codon:yes stop_codon:yes gene_type:complete